MYYIVSELLLGLIYYIPAFVANGSGPLVKNGTPIDFRRNFVDGRRILGDGKTFEGLLMAITYGTTVGVALSFFFGYPWILISFGEALGAMVGDMIGAFIKRRLNIPRGGRALGLDQLDFVLGSTLFGILTGLRVSLIQFLFVALIAFLAHVVSNAIAFRLKIKSVPW
ncbi:CDP-2,3-bis-(O-geranylgeranyl)-sn-glycerol synthase [Metallosphaera tengchongensis]|uniref:CDP-archaeol synthase n=1 Tax=Metallosphaera tengchongensis TaxID=1532350 RepID=A0A6N0NRT9_9CREN|nr:CDP-2,3-bis-(O-geranylgeranyl)-sn-glycerol synthase [Metallosphaera tengchongensis]QKQ99593.1 CDP-2,3-bis-(O-geranylgeranyl)-sn-glycerol synthase [Metallosphaera tengchongensis]